MSALVLQVSRPLFMRQSLLLVVDWAIHADRRFLVCLACVSPLVCSLREHMLAKFGGAGSPAFYQAQRCFVESLAGYSLVCYLLQIKDR